MSKKRRLLRTNDLDSYLEGGHFESRPGRRLSWMRVSIVFLSRLWKPHILSRLGNDIFLPNFFPFISHPTIRHHIYHHHYVSHKTRICVQYFIVNIMITFHFMVQNILEILWMCIYRVNITNSNLVPYLVRVLYKSKHTRCPMRKVQYSGRS
jgi:hypothetical protein